MYEKEFLYKLDDRRISIWKLITTEIYRLHVDFQHSRSLQASGPVIQQYFLANTGEYTFMCFVEGY